MGSNSSSTQQNGNPILYTFDGITIQPYWLIIAQLIVIQMLQRLYSKFRCVGADKQNKKSWYIALEIAVLGDKISGVEPTEYSVLDFILSLISVAHFGYACYRQSYCASNVRYSAWGCYNAFGYRLYNYVLPSVISVLVNSIVQGVNTYKAYNANKSSQTKSTGRALRYLKRFLLFATIMLNLLICVLFVPFCITNALPMFVGFFWILIPVLCALILVYAIFITILVSCISQCEMCGNYCKRFFGTHCLIGLQVFGCLVLSMAYNYSQYCYFGGGYITVIGYEYQSRDTATWAQALSNSSVLVTHNVLAFF